MTLPYWKTHKKSVEWAEKINESQYANSLDNFPYIERYPVDIQVQLGPTKKSKIHTKKLVHPLFKKEPKITSRKKAQRESFLQEKEEAIRMHKQLRDEFFADCKMMTKKQVPIKPQTQGDLRRLSAWHDDGCHPIRDHNGVIVKIACVQECLCFWWED